MHNLQFSGIWYQYMQTDIWIWKEDQIILF